MEMLDATDDEERNRIIAVPLHICLPLSEK